MLQLELRTDLGAKVIVEVPSLDQLLEVQAYYGARGWTSGEIPSGGYLFPYDNEQDFNWALIGARPFTNSEGEVMIMHRGVLAT